METDVLEQDKDLEHIQSDVKLSENILTDSVHSKEKSEIIFKKPSFIGPKKGLKSSTKKPVNLTNERSEGENGVVNDAPKEHKSVVDPKNFPTLPYDVPIWKGTPIENYTLEEMKTGVIQSVTHLKDKSFFVFGRIDCCDIVMAHPTISRYHAVLQYRGVPDGDLEKGFYIFDLDSTHGTFLNGSKLKPKIYARVRVGHILKFGCSTRFFLLQGPEYDQEEESELTFTELKEKRKLELEERKRKEEEELRLKEEAEEEEKRKIEERGISWGLGEDADEEEDLSENPFAVMTNEELYIDDPKKALKHWFEREGEELVFETEQVEKGLMACKIVLPLDDERGQEIVVETSARNKKEAQLQCALEACRTIDKMGLFRQTKQEAKKRQNRNWEENDYYDSDEDSFLDRTGDLDKKRQKRMRKVGKLQETVETYESLMAKHVVILKDLTEAEARLEQLISAEQPKHESENDDIDALDAFMKTLKNNKPGKLEIKKSKDDIANLKKEEEHLRKLINIVKPTSMPELIKPTFTSSVKEESKESKQIENLGKPRHTAEQIEKPTSQSASTEEEQKLKGKSVPSSKKNIVGASMPDDASITSDSSKSFHSMHVLPCDTKIKSKPKVKVSKPPEEPMDEDYTNLVWQPPKGQTGDGRTSLNDKYGY